MLASVSSRQLLKHCTNNKLTSFHSFMISFKVNSSTSVQSTPQTNQESLPSIRDLRSVLLEHTAKIYSSPKLNYELNNAHDRSVGAQSAVIPLASRFATSWRTYLHNKNAYRFGVILEELDILATYIGYKHNQNPEVALGTPAHHEMSIITRRIDRIDVFPGAKFCSDRDIIMSGYVSWVKNSSMEVTMQVQQEDSESNGNLKTLLTAKFVMISVLPDLTSRVPNVPLLLNTEAERKEFEAGEHRKVQRALRDKTFISNMPPTEEENELIRSLIVPSLDKYSLSDSRAKLSGNQRWMKDTKTSTVMMCYPEQVTLQGFLFNGYLFREAYDIAWANTAQFSKRMPVCVGVTNAIVPTPIPVNSLLHYNSEVCYTDGRFVEVIVDTEMEDFENGKYNAKNTFNFTFDTLGELPQLIPCSYSDVLRYLHARREFLFYKNNKYD